MMTSTPIKTESVEAPIVSLQKFCRSVGISPVTAWRYRRAKMLRTINIAGRQYVTREAIAEFMQRAEAGEFAKAHPVPVNPYVSAVMA